MPKTEKKHNSARAILTGLLAAVLILLAVSALSASLVNAEKLELAETESFLIPAGGAAACLLAGLFASAGSRERQFLTGLAPAGLLIALRLIVRAFSGEGAVFDPATLKMLAAFAAGGTIGAFLGMRRKKKRRKAHAQRG